MKTRRKTTMGDRANVLIEDVYLYTHYDGSELPFIVQEALKRGEDRWDDAQYLARVVFCEMVKDDLLGTTGYGISAELGDGEYELLKLDCDGKMVTIGKKSWPFAMFVELERAVIMEHWR
jgi:hypothetical protein